MTKQRAKEIENILAAVRKERARRLKAEDDYHRRVQYCLERIEEIREAIKMGPRFRHRRVVV